MSPHVELGEKQRRQALSQGGATTSLMAPLSTLTDTEATREKMRIEESMEPKMAPIQESRAQGQGQQWEGPLEWDIRHVSPRLMAEASGSLQLSP